MEDLKREQICDGLCRVRTAPNSCVNEPKRTGAHSAKANILSQNPLELRKYLLVLLKLMKK